MLIGITGGIATGKSLALRVLRRKGGLIFSADEAARSTGSPEGSVFKRIVELFGENVLVSDREIDRARVSKIVFENDDMRKKLNQITHPPIIRLLKSQIDSTRVDFPPDTIVIVEVPLLFETKLACWFDLVVVISSPESLQIERLKTRNSMDEVSALSRIRSQMNDTQRRRLADVVLDNIGSVENFEKTVENFWSTLIPGGKLA